MVMLGGCLARARFLRRERRFVVYARLRNRDVECFLSNTGRLEFMQADCQLVIRPREGKPGLPFEVLVAFDDLVPVVVDARIPNMVVKEALERHEIKPLRDYSWVRTEKRIGSHRLDFLLTNHEQTYVEVKGCTMASGKTALYPDAPTERGRNHLRLLARLQSRGMKTVIFFLSMRADVNSFRANSVMDPEFATLLSEAARKGTRVVSFATDFTDNRVRIGRRLRVLLE